MHSKLPAEERRAVTVEAVVELAGRQNPGEITTAAIAKHMKVTQGALFRHFPSKDAIFEAVMDWVAHRLLARIEAAAAGQEPLAALRAMFDAHVGFVVEHPGVPRMLFGELQRAEATAAKRMAQALVQRYSARLAGIIKQGQALGEIAGDIDPQGAAVMFIGTIQGLIMQSLLSGRIERMRATAPGAFAIYVRGLQARP